MSNIALRILAVVLALILVYVLATFERAAMPRPPRTAVAESAPREFVIENARVFDGRTTLPKASIHVRDGLIVAVGEVSAPSAVKRIDGTGKTALPGLIDSHVHTWGSAREDALRFGVTSMLDMFSASEQLSGAREQRLALTPTHRADFFSAGTLATVSGGHGTQFGMQIPTVDSAEAAASWVADRKRENSDYIKIVVEDLSAYRTSERWPTLAEASVRALVEAAHANELMAVVHVSKLSSAQMVFDAGANGLVHIFQDEVTTPEFTAAASSRPFFITPTLTVIAGMAGESPSVATDAVLAPRLTPEQLQTLNARFNKSGAKYPELIERSRENVRLLHAAGVPILAGSDAPNPGTAHGASIHEEMAQLVKAGLSNEAALAAATSAPAAAFSLTDRGQIAPGLRADILLVNGDPTADITATRNIAAIYKNGSEVGMK